MRFSLSPLLPLLALGFSLPVVALSDDSQQPINIESNRAVHNVLENGERLTYIGDVVMTQGSLTIRADKIDIFSSARKIQRLSASGKPAELSQRSSLDDRQMDASAEQIEYNITDETAILTGNASVVQQGSVVKAERITYDIKQERVQARAGNQADGQNGGRVNMILQPSTEEPAANGNTDRE